MRLLPRITFLSIGEIGCCVLGRGGAVGAGRELPAHPRVPSLPVPRRYNNRGSPWRHGMRMHGGGVNGGIWIVMRPAVASPQKPDCRGGVFATRRFPRPLAPPCAHTIGPPPPPSSTPAHPPSHAALFNPILPRFHPQLPPARRKPRFALRIGVYLYPRVVVGP